jgi:hypothetical protein
VPKRLFEGFEGVLQTDGYEGYGAIGREPGIVHVGCWAHARRRFTDALKGAGGRRKKGSKPRAKHSQAAAGLRFVQKLYAIERRVKDATPEERLRVRQAESLPVVAALRAWLDHALQVVVPQSLTGKAVAYLDAQWPKLVRVFDYGFVPIDTNRVENAVRPFVVGRKNWLFAETVGGAEASANLYSVVETAKANGLELGPTSSTSSPSSRRPAASTTSTPSCPIASSCARTPFAKRLRGIKPESGRMARKRSAAPRQATFRRRTHYGHNHPSADPTPSAEDREITRRLTAAGKLLGIQLIDHVVVSAEGGASCRVRFGRCFAKPCAWE